MSRKLLKRMRDEIGLLKTLPESGPVYPMVPGVRRLVIAKGAFLVFYRLATSVQVVHIRRSERKPLKSINLYS